MTPWVLKVPLSQRGDQIADSLLLVANCNADENRYFSKARGHVCLTVRFARGISVKQHFVFLDGILHYLQEFTAKLSTR